MIDTAEKRRSVIDFGKGTYGTGMPLPVGSIGVTQRVHVLNLYSGIAPTRVPSFYWRNKNRVASLWRKGATPKDSSTQVI